MANKVFYKTEISTEEQNVTILPTEDFNGIVIETKELDGSSSSKLYLNEDEMELLFLKCREMLNYLNQQP